MNEDRFGEQIRQLLNQGAEVDAATAERLRAARELALSRQRPEPAPVLRLAYNVLGSFGGWGGLWLRLLLPTALLVAAVATLYMGQQNQGILDAAEIDAELLSDDLPIDAYLDRGFQDWLKKRGGVE
ncbi:MAG TPA: DUF3619 family protein [Burkholderiales bacterium]|nr:DUF3619 family protein [Burkholderiales bacterium]